jgi:integrase
MHVECGGASIMSSHRPFAPRPANPQELARHLSAVNSEKFPDLKHYKVPVNPVKKWQVEEDRDRVLSEEELTQIGDALKQNPRYEEAAFFFQLAIMTGGRFAELKRMKWDESSITFGIN